MYLLAALPHIHELGSGIADIHELDSGIAAPSRVNVSSTAITVQAFAVFLFTQFKK